MYRFGKKPDDLLVARDWLIRVIRLAGYKYPALDNTLIHSYERKIANKFSFEEISHFFDLLKENEGKAEKFLSEKFKRDRIPFNPTKEEMKEIK